VSRYYNMQVQIEDPKPEKVEAIKMAMAEFWEFPVGEWQERDAETMERAKIGPQMWVSMDGHLTGGDEEGKFAAELAEEVWKANGAYCEVSVIATYLEDPPCERYTADESDYEEWEEKNADKASAGKPEE